MRVLDIGCGPGDVSLTAAEAVDPDTLAERLRREVISSKRALMLPPHVTAWAVLPV